VLLVTVKRKNERKHNFVEFAQSGVDHFYDRYPMGRHWRGRAYFCPLEIREIIRHPHIGDRFCPNRGRAWGGQRVSSFINLKIMSNPLNWITLAIWVYTIGFAAHATGLVGQSSQSRAAVPNRG